MTRYDKLVRDYIPYILKEKQLDFTVRKVEGEEYLMALKNKLKEEVGEYLENPSLEELADIREVLDALVLAHGYELHDFSYVKRHKRCQKGGFEKAVFLEEVIE